MIESPFCDKVAFSSQVSGELTNSDIHPEEAALLGEGVSSKRQQEFIAGRVAAKSCLTVLGCSSPPPILKGKRREPLWPKGICGSISHSGFLAICATAWKKDFSSIGLDLQESNRKCRTQIKTRICTPSEQNWVGNNNDHLLLLFSAKESVYKALYPITEKYFGFKDVTLAFQEKDETFAGELLAPLTDSYKQGFTFQVGVQRTANYVLTFMTV